MELEKKTIVWLTADEVQNAVREYAREKGYGVSVFARVSGLEALNEARHSVGVVTLHSTEEVS